MQKRIKIECPNFRSTADVTSGSISKAIIWAFNFDAYFKLYAGGFPYLFTKENLWMGKRTEREK